MPTTVAFAHANGFCGGVWRPVEAALSRDFETRVWDFPGHGSAPRWEPPIDWWDLATWTLRQVDRAESPVIGVGHSMGGAAMVMAEIKAPGTFAALLLIEPIVFPPPFRKYVRPQILLAKKRRNHFESREEARANFAGKLPFSAWDPLALDGYIDCGLIETPQGIELACRPSDEAEIYRAATRLGVWDLLGEVDPPVMVLAGDVSNIPRSFVERIASQIPHCEYEIVPDTGHFLPMEQPEVVADHIKRIGARLTE